MMKILYGTGNKAKIAHMREMMAAHKLDIELVEPDASSMCFQEPRETGGNPLENARIKARAYYNAYRAPVFSCDTGLILAGIPEKLQPGVHVRTVNSKRLNDDEMIAYYGGLAARFGDITAYYQNAICLIYDENLVFERTDASLESDRFIITKTPHPKRVPGFPLDSLSVQLASGRYYYDAQGAQADDAALGRGFARFFSDCLRRVGFACGARGI